MWNLKRNDIDRNELTKQKKIHRFRDRTDGYQESCGSGPLRLSPETGELWVRWAGRRLSALPLGILVPDAGHLNQGSRHPSRSLQLRVFSIWGGDSEQRGEEEGVVCHGDRKPQVGDSEQQY